MTGCATCKFLVQVEEREFECRRYPPQMVSVGNALEMSDLPSFPRILSPHLDWCGEYVESEGEN